MVYRLFKKPMNRDPNVADSSGWSKAEKLACLAGNHLFDDNTWYGPNSYCDRCGNPRPKNIANDDSPNNMPPTPPKGFVRLVSDND